MKYTIIKFDVPGLHYKPLAEVEELCNHRMQKVTCSIRGFSSVYIFWRERIDPSRAMLITLESNLVSQVSEFDTYDELKNFIKHSVGRTPCNTT